tara:strand:- start:388 stop:1488 length:1101 start_codon:yes stop_codon:yes gene_type:complete
MRVLIAPQEFKESLTAQQVTAAINRGIHTACPTWKIDALPMSDGGPGFLDVISTHIPSISHPVQVQNPLGDTIYADYLRLTNKNIVLIEAAKANGLALIPTLKRDPITSGSAGVGDLIHAALHARSEKIIVGLGGSASSDGGIGMAKVLGADFFDRDGNTIGPGISELHKLTEINWQPSLAIKNTTFQVASDVKNPLCGPMGAAAIFGPQKGATSQQIIFIEEGLKHLAEVLKTSLGIDVLKIEGGGAAGGLAAGLNAFLGAEIHSGFDFVAHTINLEKHLSKADIVITGEGRYDNQSSNGKTTGRIKKLCEEQNKPCIIFAGETTSKDKNIWTIADNTIDKQQSMSKAKLFLEQAAHQWAKGYIN